MLVYVSKFEEFSADVEHNRIADTIESNVRDKLGLAVSPNEFRSWRNSLGFMRNALSVAGLKPDAGIAVEFQIPLTSKRVDVLVSGLDDNDQKQVVIVELKQWQSVEATDKESVVKTILGGSLVETTHPSYQAWSYATFIEDYNEAVQTKSISLQPCSFLHNCETASVLRDSRYTEDLERAPLFLGNEVEKLADFISRYVRKGDDGLALYEINEGRIRPSKQLIEYITSLLNGNDEFTLLDEQKLVSESILALDKKARGNNRQVLIVEGGPGTGKSVLAINLLAKLTARDRVSQYVTRNTAPREVFESKLTGSFKSGRITSLFKSAGSYINSSAREVDVLLVDEAHRLSPKSGPFGNLGENQVKEVIQASKLSVFFIDEYQQVLLNDIGTREEIERWAQHFDAEVTHMELASQFRCNGSDGYLAWLDRMLGIRDTANTSLKELNYDFRVFDSPSEMFDQISLQDKPGQSARVVAGYCWDWVSKKEPEEFDIVFPEHNFNRRWNLKSDGNYWIVKPESISEIGCIHTCQGLELGYVGVIIGEDFIVRDGEVITDGYKRSKDDRSIRGFKTRMKKDPVETTKKVDRIIKNTYRTLMTRGMKGCFIYCVDPETNDHFKKALNVG